MAQRKKQETTIGNTAGKAPILANEKPSTGGQLTPFPPDTGKEPSGTKPMSVAESLSLWQTACSDLQLYGFKTAILARDNRIFFLMVPPASIGKMTINGGHLCIDGLPVSDL